MADTTTAPREMVSRSGIPFQLAVTEAIQQIAGLHGLVDIRTEVPYSDGFLDLVVLKDTVCFVIECKRADEKQWVFPVTAKSLDVARLRVE